MGSTNQDNQNKILNPPRQGSNFVTGSNLGISDKATIPIVAPNYVQQYLLPTSEELKQKIYSSRDKIFNALHQNVHEDYVQPMIIIAGPSFISNIDQAKKCGQWIQQLKQDKSCLLTMRVNLKSYNEKYAEIGEKDLPSIMTFDISQGIPECRELLHELAQKVPLVGDVCDLITPQFFHDLFSLGLLSSTLVESQLHREMISACSFAVGIQTNDSYLDFDKNFYSYKINSSLDAMYASSQPHQFLNITKAGLVAVVGTTGNPDTFVILEINHEITIDDLNQYFTQVYKYEKHNNNIPKIMLDLGKLTNDNYQHKLDVISHLFNDNTVAKKINGFLIDSGNDYDQENDILINTKKMIDQLAILSAKRISS